MFLTSRCASTTRSTPFMFTVRTLVLMPAGTVDKTSVASANCGTTAAGTKEVTSSSVKRAATIAWTRLRLSAVLRNSGQSWMPSRRTASQT